MVTRGAGRSRSILDEGNDVLEVRLLSFLFYFHRTCVSVEFILLGRSSRRYVAHVLHLFVPLQKYLVIIIGRYSLQTLHSGICLMLQMSLLCRIRNLNIQIFLSTAYKRYKAFVLRPKPGGNRIKTASSFPFLERRIHYSSMLSDLLSSFREEVFTFLRRITPYRADKRVLVLLRHSWIY